LPDGRFIYDTILAESISPEITPCVRGVYRNNLSQSIGKGKIMSQRNSAVLKECDDVQSDERPAREQISSDQKGLSSDHVSSQGSTSVAGRATSWQSVPTGWRIGPSQWESPMVTQQRPLPPMPEIGHPESYYSRAAHEAQKRGDTHAHEAAKVGQYVTLAMDPRLLWEDKLRYFRHALNRHCVPPRIPDDAVWTFYKDLQNLVRDHAGREALRIASAEDDLYAAYTSVGQEREKIEAKAEEFFGRLITTEQCPDWFHDEDFAQLKLIRDQWI
jgi:hypothetical protein